MLSVLRKMFDRMEWDRKEYRLCRCDPYHVGQPYEQDKLLYLSQCNGATGLALRPSGIRRIVGLVRRRHSPRQVSPFSYRGISFTLGLGNGRPRCDINSPRPNALYKHT